MKRRARPGPEALVETSRVGVVVFDARSGRIRVESAGAGRVTTVVFVVPLDFLEVAATQRRVPLVTLRCLLETGEKRSTEVRPGVAIPPVGGE